MARGTPVLMYHELAVAGRSLCRADEGYRRYCIADTAFNAQLGWLAENGYEGWNVTQALARGTTASESVVITFDDGCETDLTEAAPRLADAGFGATFFVVSGWVGRPGYLSRGQLRELRAGGFEIGAHSRTHPYLTDLGPSDLHAETAGCKDDLEQWLGGAVLHYSCPGGRWNAAVQAAVQAAGFESMSTSRIGALAAATDRFRIPRTAIVEDTDEDRFARICRGQGQWMRQAQSELLAGAKAVMGNALYERIRGAVLRG